MARLIVLVFALALLGASPVRAADQVDLALVIAVDVSNSMDPDEQALQREGFVEAFRSPVVHDAIRKGIIGRIAVIYMDWAGVLNQKVLVPWTILEGRDGALAFADRLAAAPHRRAPRTSIASAIEYSVTLLAESGVDALRKVIDVSGDGPNNQGRLVTLARDEALEKGIVINGLPIMLKRPTGWWDMENLDLYYRDCIIGGPGAFLVPVRERHQFADAVRSKIIREVAGLEGPRIVLTQSEPRGQAETPGRMNCAIPDRGFTPFIFDAPR